MNRQNIPLLVEHVEVATKKVTSMGTVVPATVEVTATSKDSHVTVVYEADVDNQPRTGTYITIAINEDVK